MSRLPSDYLPPVGFESDKRGEVAPTITIQFRTPRRVEREVTITGLASGEERILTLIDEITDEMVEEAVRLARQRLFALRLERAVSVNDIMFRQAQLTDYADLHYTSQQNMEQVIVSIGPQPISEERVRQELSQLYMMVLYGGSSVAAISMKALSDAKAQYKRTLQNSGWGSEFFMSVQVRPNETYSPFYAPLQFSADSIVADAYYAVSWVGENKATATAGLTQSISSSTAKAFVPILTANAGQVFTPFDTYTFANGALGGRSAGGDPTYAPWTITTEGTYCYGITAGLFAVGISGDPLTFLGIQIGVWEEKIPDEYKIYSNWLDTEVTVTPASPYYLSDEAYEQLPFDQTLVAYAEKGAGGGLTVRAEAPGLYHVYGYDKTVSLDTPFNVATIGKTFSPTQTEGIPVKSRVTADDIAYAGTFGTAHVNGNEVYVSSVGDVSATTFSEISTLVTGGAYGDYVSETDIDPGYLMHVTGLPYAVRIDGAVKVYCSVERVSLDLATFGERGETTHHTPYGVETNDLDFIPWLHADNGVHVIQGFGYGKAPAAPTIRRLYLDGQEYGPKLAQALGCSVDDIQAVILDVPLKRIMQFK